MSIKRESKRHKSAARLVVVALAVVAAFFGAYAYASARTSRAVGSASQLATLPSAGSGSTGSLGCACCGSSAPTQGGVTGAKAVGTAKVAGNVQRISVDLSKGYYDPNTIQLKAGVPAEITFGQSSGCTSQVISQDLGFSEDLSSGPRTVRLPALSPGEYSFSCGMQMVFGKIVVK